jgi:dTDP-4-amino-4,6-dideoxygalactose transaminase
MEGPSNLSREGAIEMEIPFVDLKVQYAEIKGEIQKAVDAVFESQQFILGPNVKKLEEHIAAYSNVHHGIGVSSGTDALLVSLMAMNIVRGHGVITSPFTFFATAGVIARLGATPIFIDIDPSTYNMDPEKLRQFLEGGCDVDQETGKPVDRKMGCIIQAMIPVHLYGQCADMDPIMELAQKYRLDVTEDAAQAIGAIYYSKRLTPKGDEPAIIARTSGENTGTRGERPRAACKAGSMGRLGCFSFFPTKNLGGFGDAGMVVTDDEIMAEKIKVLRVHGSQPKYHHHLIGGNFRLDELQAAILNVKFLHLERWTEARRRNAERYDRLFEEMGLTEHIHLPVIKGGNRHIFNQYVIRVPHRNKLREFLYGKGVGTEVYYPIPLHLQKCFEYLGYKKGDFPESEKASEETVALPIYPELSHEQQEYVVDQIKNFYERT